MRNGLLATLLCVMTGSLAMARELYVDGRTGSDQNAGSKDAPVATIGKAVELAQARDVVRVTPGVYAESVSVNKSSLTIESIGPGKTTLIGTVVAPLTELKPVEGVPGVFVWPLPAAAAAGPWVFYNGKRLAHRDKPLKQKEDQMCSYTVTKGRTALQLQVNINGKSLPPDARIEVPIRGDGISIRNQSNVTIRGLELLRFARDGVSLWNCRDCVVEYCVARDTGNAGLNAVGCRGCTIRRNTVSFCNRLGLYYTLAMGLLEENLVVANHYGWEQKHSWGGQIKGNRIKNSVIRHNFACDEWPQETTVGPQTVSRKGWGRMSPGIWGDINCYGNSVYGNAVARQNHAGIYVEGLMDGNHLAFNALQDCAMGITFRISSQNLFHHNWIFNQEAVGRTQTFLPLDQGDLPMWGRQWFEGICLWQTQMRTFETSHDNVGKDNLIQVSGRAVAVPTDDVEWEVTPQNTYERSQRNLLDHNLYNAAASRKEGFALVSHTKLGTFEAYQQATGWDRNGRVGEFTPADIGLAPLWTVPPGTMHPETPVAILYDPSVEVVDPTYYESYNGGPFFWRTDRFRPHYLARRTDHAWAFYPYLTDPKGPRAHRGDRALEARGGKSETFKGQDIGWWSVCFPVSPGAKMLVESHVRAAHVAPHGAGGGILMFAEFTDEVGHDRARHFVVGGGKRPDVAKGDYHWQRIGETLTVPASGKWMRVFLGIRDSAGSVLFDDIRLGLAQPFE